MKALSFSVSENREACVRLIEAGGLKFVFPLIMGRGLPDDLEKKKATHQDRKEVEGNVISIISQLCIQIFGVDDADITSSQRLIGKFIENQFEKIDRLVELFSKYKKQLNTTDLEIAQSLPDEDEDVDEDDLLAKVRKYMMMYLRRFIELDCSA